MASLRRACYAAERRETSKVGQRSDSSAVGFSIHTGWAAAVVVSGPLRAPRIVARQRVRLADSDDTVRAQVYHRAADLSAGAAATLVGKARDAAARRAGEAMRALRAAHRLNAAGMVASAAKIPSDLATILRSHALIHAAEGALYREALERAAEDCDLTIVRIPRRELPDRFASVLGLDAAGARDLLAAMGRPAGPPWARDQKDAAMAAIVARLSD